METESVRYDMTTNSKPSVGTNNSTSVDTFSSTPHGGVVTNHADDTTNPMDIDTITKEVSNVPKNADIMVDSKVPAETSTMHRDTADQSSDILERVLYRLTGGLPKCELNLIVQESNECEAALLEEIRILEEALAVVTKDDGANTARMVDEVPHDPTIAHPTATTAADSNALCNEVLQQIVQSPLTPLDRFYTASALLGRLRNDLAVPSAASMKNPDATKKVSPIVESNEEKAFQDFVDPTNRLYTIYTQNIVDQETLLSLWKKISMNRAAFVFKRPVKSEEAPGYTDRIFFPMDLSLIRKRILTNNIKTYMDFHYALALISHNCVKYNGRDTDYGRVARDFEAMVDHTIVQAVCQEASNLDGTSNAVESSTKEMRTPLENKNTQGTPISAVKPSPITTASSVLTETEVAAVVADTTKGTNEACVTSPKNTEPDAKPADKEANDMVTSS